MRLLMLSGDRAVAAGRRGPLYETQRGFSRWFERIDILLPRADGPVTTRALFGNVHLHPAETGRAGQVGAWKRRGVELAREHRPALIVSHDYGLFPAGRAAAAISRASGVPYVSEIHGVTGFPFAADWNERARRSAARLYVRWASERALAFRVVNAGELKPLLESWGVPTAKIAVIRGLYLDLATFRPHAAAPPREQELVYAGRFVPGKGLERVVDAVALLAERGVRCRALLVGAGPLEAGLRERALRRGVAESVRFRGWTDSTAELAELYRRSALAVCASGCEGGPRAPVEAMACGVPVVSTPVGMMKELVRDGENGWLSGFDAESLAAAAARALEDEPRRAAAGRRAHEDAQAFDYARAIRAYALGIHALAGEELPEPAPESSPASRS